jgi:hypothetical protein
MNIKITPNDKGNPTGKLADAERHLTEGPFDGLKLIGFSIWGRRGGNGRNVTFLARQYTVNGERRAFALLRPIGDVAAQTRVGDLILDAYQQYEERAAALVMSTTRRRGGCFRSLTCSATLRRWNSRSPCRLCQRRR